MYQKDEQVTELNRYRIGRSLSEIKPEDGPQGDISARVNRNKCYFFFKRLTDIVVSLFGLIVLFPLFLVISCMIFFEDFGPILYKQKRTGLNGEHFTMYKFRTMKRGADKQQAAMRKLNEMNGPAFKCKNDPRVTKFGHFLRKSSLDELPQLMNCLIGNMSLVGPRPLPCEEQEACNAYQAQRLLIKPGITCTWQATGRSDIHFDEWMEMDLKYVQNCGFFTDWSILIMTVGAVLGEKGAY